MRRVRNPSRQIGATRCQRVKFLTRAERDQDRNALDCDDLANKNLLLQQNGERIEKLSQQDRGFLNVVEIGQDNTSGRKTLQISHNFMQWPVVNSSSLPRDEESSQPKGWIQGNSKIGSVLEVATCCLHGKYGVEIRISSLNRDNTLSWVRISHGSNKFVINLNNNEQEIPEVQLGEYASKLNA